jgi:adenosine deaminase
MVSDSGGFAPSTVVDSAVIATKDAPHHPVATSTSNSSSTSGTSTSTSTNSDIAQISKNKKSSTSSKFRLVRYLSDLPHWQSYNDHDEHFIQDMPKIELHVHLDGSFDPDFLWKYMQEHPNSIVECLPCQTILPWQEENNKKKTLPVRQLVQDCQSSQDYHKLCTCRGYRSLKQMLNCFEIFLPLVRRNLSLLEQLAFDFCQRQYEQNVIYTEVRYSPFLLAEGFVDNNDNENGNKKDDDNDVVVVDGAAVLQAITAGLRRGCHKFNIIINQILCAITWRPDWAQPTLDLVLQHWHDYPCATVGIDIAAGEEHFDEKNFTHLHQGHYQVFTSKALPDSIYKDIPVTIHAGESPDESSSDNVRRAVEEYGASRIGHGYRVVNDAVLMAQLRRNKIHLEVCPTSSDETGGWVYPSPLSNDNGDDNDEPTSRKNNDKKPWSQHPIVEMSKAGLSFSFSSDDPAVFHTSLAWQYRVAMVKMGFTREQMLQCNLHAIDAAFCSPEEKNKLKRHFLDFAAFSGLEYVTASTDTTGTWRRRTSISASSTGGSIHRAHHTAPTADSSTPSQWKRSMSANFVDRVYVYKPGSADKTKEYEYL